MLQTLLLFFLFAIVFVVIIVLAVLHNVVNTVNKVKDALKGTGRKQTKDTSIVDTRSHDIASRKIFTKDEGEYVDFQEV